MNSDVEYECCSIASTNATVDNLPGPGRLLGNLYSSAGRRLEDGLGRVASRMGYGPNAMSMKIQELLEDKSLRSFTRRKKLKKKCKDLAQYVKYVQFTTYVFDD